MYGLCEDSKYILLIRKDFNNRFFTIWEKGFREYEAGNWKNARKYFKETQTYCKWTVTAGSKSDGPSTTLLKYMENRNWTAPKSWVGVRELNEK